MASPSDEDAPLSVQIGSMRVTACCRKTGLAWRIVRERFSAPFDWESGKALFDLEP